MASFLSKGRAFLFFPLYKGEPGTNPLFQFRVVNNTVAWAHFLQFLVVVSLYATKFRCITPNQIFVSDMVNLTSPHHMIHVFDGSAAPSSCPAALDVIRSTWYRSRPHLDNSDVIIHGVGDDVLFDLRNTTTVEFYPYTYRLNVSAMIACFFFLSWAFQLLNGWYVENEPDGPRYIQYVEYSLSASLTIVVMALNTGIQDLYTILNIFVLFFGMNVFGILAEFMMHLAEKWCTRFDFGLFEIDAARYRRNQGTELTRRLPYENYPIGFRNLWLVPHLCGWVLFLFAWLPIIIKYTKTQQCSENSVSQGVPWFVQVVVSLESTFYLLFGIVQWVVLRGRGEVLSNALADKTNDRLWWKVRLDYWTTMLSFGAKTLLAWLLLGPRLKATSLCS